MPTIIKTEPVVVREEIVETESTSSALVLLVALLVIGAIAAMGYFAWWAPTRTSAPAVIERQNTVIQDDGPDAPTIITTPSPQPIVVPGPQGPKGDQGAQGPPGDSTIIVEPPPSTTG